MVEQSPIERAARALLRSQDGLPEHKPEGWSDEIWNEEQSLQNDIEDSDWPKFVADVRAVIEALREPSAGMDQAGAIAGELCQSVGCDAERCWRAMIDELLKEA